MAEHETFQENTIYRVVVSPVEHFYVAVPDDRTAEETGVGIIETYSMKRAKLYAPNAEHDSVILTYDEYVEMKENR